MKISADFKYICNNTVEKMRNRTFFAIMELLELKTINDVGAMYDINRLAELLGDDIYQKDDNSLLGYTASTLAVYIKTRRDVDRTGTKIYKALEDGIKAEEDDNLTAHWKRKKKTIKDILLAYDEYRSLYCERNTLEDFEGKRQNIIELLEASAINQTTMYGLSQNINCIGLQDPFEALFFQRVLLLTTREKEELKEQLLNIEFSGIIWNLFERFPEDNLLPLWLDLRNKDYRLNCKTWKGKESNPISKSTSTIAKYLESLPDIYLVTTLETIIIICHRAHTLAARKGEDCIDKDSIDIFLIYKYFLPEEQQTYWLNELSARLNAKLAAMPKEQATP